MEQPDSSLQRVLGPIDATCIVIGAIVGVGIFFTPSHVAAIAGSSGVALLAWVIAGGIALLGALTFAELGGMYPNTGGHYQALRDAYGPMPAFLYVFCNATAIQAGAIAIIAVLCAENLAIAVANAGLDSMSVVLLSAVLICCLAAANIVGVRLGSRIQNATVYAKLVTLLVISGLAVWMSIAGGADASAAPVAAAPEPGAAKAGFGLVTVLFAAMVPAFFAFGGWQHALWIAGEIKEPRRNLPRAIIGGVLVVTIVYVLVNWAYFALLGYEQVRDSKAIAADAVSAHWSEFGRRTIAAAVAVSAFGVLNAQLLSGPRLINGMASDGRFFKAFAHVNKRFHTPLEAILLLGGMALVLLIGAYLLFPDGKDAIDNLTTSVVIIDAIFFALTGFALVAIRRRRKALEASSFRAPLFPVIPLLFVLGELGILTGSFLATEDKTLFLLAVIWIIAAAMLYAVFFRRPRHIIS